MKTSLIKKNATKKLNNIIITTTTFTAMIDKEYGTSSTIPVIFKEYGTIIMVMDYGMSVIILSSCHSSS